MNDEIDRLIDQLTRECDGDPWHGPSLGAILDGITAEAAAQRPATSVHSIAELVLHMTGWKREVARRLQGQPAGEPERGDWPEARRLTEAQWQSAKADLMKAQAELIAAMRALAPEALHAPVKDTREPALGTGMTAAQTILGLIQHDVYHAGQISLLKKLI